MGRAKAPEILREAVQPSRLATDTRWQRTTQPSNGKWRSLPTPGAPSFRGMEETSGGVHREPGTLLAALPLAEESNQSRAQPPLLMAAARRLYGGRYDGESFEFMQDLDVEQEVELSPPLVVEEGAQPMNVTLLIDVTTWFVAPDGSLIDPRTAGDGGPNEGLVEDNIRASIDGFEDEDEDGEDDDDDQDDD